MNSEISSNDCSCEGRWRKRQEKEEGQEKEMTNFPQLLRKLAYVVPPFGIAPNFAYLRSTKYAF